MDNYEIDPAGPWHLYTATIPMASTPCGTITRPTGDTGALVRMKFGRYAQINAGTLRTLDQRAVQQALDA